MPGTKIIYKQLGNGNNYREISGKFGDAASTADEKVINATGTDENLFKLVDGARVLPLELVRVPGHGAQSSAWAPTKGYVQTGTWAQGTGTKSEQGLSSLIPI